MHLHRQSIVPASPPGSAFGTLGSSQTLSSTQQRTGIESQCSIHEDKSLQGAVLTGRHGRTEEQVRCMHWQHTGYVHTGLQVAARVAQSMHVLIRVDRTCPAQAAISHSCAACMHR